MTRTASHADPDAHPAQRWGHADVRLLAVPGGPDRCVGRYAEVHHGCRTELFRAMGHGEWWRVAERAEDLGATVEEAPGAFAEVDPEAVPTLHRLLEQIELARRIATQAHAGQTDKAGRPHIDHPRRVAERLPDLQAQAVAWLHDVLEDTAVTADDLRAAGIDDAVVAAVGLLTRGPDDADYYARIATDPVARDVKLADIADNTDPVRTALLDPATRNRLALKYTNARRALGAMEEDR